MITRKLMLVLAFVAFFAGTAFAQSADNNARLVVLFPQSLGLSYILGWKQHRWYAVSEA